jgi:hypothetical protein
MFGAGSDPLNDPQDFLGPASLLNLVWCDGLLDMVVVSMLFSRALLVTMGL